jgi:hypothetical protein
MLTAKCLLFSQITLQRYIFKLIRNGFYQKKKFLSGVFTNKFGIFNKKFVLCKQKH